MPYTNIQQNADMSLCESVRGGTAYPIKIWLNLRTDEYTLLVYDIGMIDEDKIRTEDQRRAYDKIVLKKTTAPEQPLLTPEEKAEYPAVMAEMRNTVPGMKKLLANHSVFPHLEVQTLLSYHQYKTLKAILERLEAGPGASHE